MFALLATVLVIAFDGLITQWLILRQNPGVTFFVVRALISIPFFMALAAYIGMDLAGILAGSALLALGWTDHATLDEMVAAWRTWSTPSPKTLKKRAVQYSGPLG